MGSWLFQSPAWLAAGLAALAVPLLIHFISRSRGVRIPFGNIRLVRSARRRLVHELRLTQLLLMMLRLSLVAIAALILGGLANPGTTQQDGEVAYLTPQWLNQAKPGELAGLVQAGKSVFMLTPGFPVPQPGDDDEPVGDDDIWHDKTHWTLVDRRCSCTYPPTSENWGSIFRTQTWLFCGDRENQVCYFPE